MFTTDDLGKLILLSYWGPMLLLMGFLLRLVWKKLPFGKGGKVVSVLAVLVAVPALFILPLLQEIQKEKRKEEEYQRRYQAAKAVFDRQCQTAGEKIYRTVNNVEGLMLLRVREKYTDGKGRDPMWDDAAARSGPYPDDGELFDYISTFLEYSEGIEHGGGLTYKPMPNKTYLPRYQYVDVLQPDGKSIIRYRGGWDIGRKPLDEEANPKRPARYAFTYENNVDPELRKIWIAGTTLKVLDLKTGELLAEKTIYAFEPSLGYGAKFASQAPWSRAVKCPDDENLQLSRFFVERVLKPKPD